MGPNLGDRKAAVRRLPKRCKGMTAHLDIQAVVGCWLAKGGASAPIVVDVEWWHFQHRRARCRAQAPLRGPMCTLLGSNQCCYRNHPAPSRKRMIDRIELLIVYSVVMWMGLQSEIETEMSLWRRQAEWMVVLKSVHKV